MKIKQFVVLLLLILVFPAHAQLLWKVSGNGLSKESYLFGTHHLIDKQLIPQFDSILAVCGRCEAVVGELDMKVPGMQQKMMKASVMKDRKIKDLVSSEEYLLLDGSFKSLMGVGMSVLGSFKPMVLLSMHQLMLYLKSTGSKKQPSSVDELFQKQARQDKKKVVGLETLEFQMSILFDTIPMDRQVELLLYEVRESDSLLKDLSKLNSVYISGDLEQMRALDVEDASMKPEERKMLVEDRNRNWLGQLPGLFKNQSCFVAVGCLHLVGETGLIQLLRSEGYTVEPVRFN